MLCLCWPALYFLHCSFTYTCKELFFEIIYLSLPFWHALFFDVALLWQTSLSPRSIWRQSEKKVEFLVYETTLCEHACQLLLAKSLVEMILKTWTRLIAMEEKAEHHPPHLKKRKQWGVPLLTMGGTHSLPFAIWWKANHRCNSALVAFLNRLVDHVIFFPPLRPSELSFQIAPVLSSSNCVPKTLKCLLACAD